MTWSLTWRDLTSPSRGFVRVGSLCMRSKSVALSASASASASGSFFNVSVSFSVLGSASSILGSASSVLGSASFSVLGPASFSALVTASFPALVARARVVDFVLGFGTGGTDSSAAAALVVARRPRVVRLGVVTGESAAASVAGAGSALSARPFRGVLRRGGILIRQRGVKRGPPC